MSTELRDKKEKKEKKVKVDTEVDVVGQQEVKKEKKDKKRKEREDAQVEPELAEGTSRSAAEGETKEERKARKLAKKEAKKADLEAQVIVPSTAASENPVEVKEETKEERKARRRAEKLAKELSDPAAPSTKIEEPAPSIPSDEVALKKKSKQQRKEEGASKWTAEVSEANQAMQARAEKSPIYQDDSLSDMAKKGLYYCELHAASQVELQAPEYRWKFNKARQGWLMRNVWNDTEVPEVYFDRVVGYLKTLPGSARKGMIETAKKHATAVAKPTKSDEAQPEAEAEAEAEVEEPVVTEEEKEGEEKEAGSGGEAAVEMRRDRAQRILKALGAR